MTRSRKINQEKVQGSLDTQYPKCGAGPPEQHPKDVQCAVRHAVHRHPDRVAKRIRDDIAPKVAADTAYKNAKQNTLHTARMAHDQTLAKVMQHLLKDDTQVYKQFVENESFKRFVGDMVYALTTQ